MSQHYLQAVHGTWDEPTFLLAGIKKLIAASLQELLDEGIDSSELTGTGERGEEGGYDEQLPGVYSYDEGGIMFAIFATNNTDDDGGESDDDGGEEIQTLPQGCILPGGKTNGARVIGCVALKKLGPTCGEVRRLFIDESHRAAGSSIVTREKLIRAVARHAENVCGFFELNVETYERIKSDDEDDDDNDGEGKRSKGGGGTSVRFYEKFGFTRMRAYCKSKEKDHVCLSLMFAAGASG
jgi:GNAT superfamily N-acetyltransferase